MADVYVRRTTALLLSAIVILCLTVVGLLVHVLTSRGTSNETHHTDVETIAPEKIELVLKEPWEREYRIPTTTQPLHYDLYLHPDLETGLFSGRVAILVAVTAPTTFLVAHVKKMNVTRTQVQALSGNREVPLSSQFEYEPNQFWVVRPASELTPGNYSLELEFNGSLEKSIVGFYKSVYTNSRGEKKSIATSKFQPTDARAAFPCFDEPSFKSTFSVTLVRPSQGYVALSNMPEQSQTTNSPRPGLTEVQFHKSVPMVTYLACFIVCDFEHVQTRTQDNKLFRVYATPEQISRTHYARDIGVSILNYFEKYFEVEYPLPKQDMIAIPDFVSGAMEHWGLITYRETNLLYDTEGSSSYNKQRVATVVSHELAHMWFGNLVTLSWWDDLWLNEGFASYVEYKGVHQYHPDWDMMEQFVTSDLQPVMRLDAQLTSHPIIQPVAHPDQITEIFDQISYNKGAAVLRMLDDFLGDAQFREGVRNFLRAYAYDNAVTSDLWSHLEQVSTDRLNISAIMGTWTKQMGYPVLHASRVAPDAVEVRQERFLQDPSAISVDDSNYGYVWDVPVTFRTGVVEREQHWLYRDMPSLRLSLPSGSTWVKLNVGQRGYYRVSYDPDMWDQLITLLAGDHELLSPADRAQLLDDSLSLAAAGRLPYSTALRLVAYLPREQHLVPWQAASHHLADLHELLETTAAYPNFMRYVRQLVQQRSEALGWQDQGGQLERRLRPLVLSLQCRSGDKSCLSRTRELLQGWITHGQHIPVNLRSMVYKYGMETADYDDWQVMLQRYEEEVNAQEKSKLMQGLTSVNKNWIIQRFLDESRNESVVRSQDYFSGLIQAGRNPAAGHIVWEFVKSEWPSLVSRFTLNNRYLGIMVKAVVSKFTRQQQIEDAERFFAANPEAGSGARARLQALEEARSRVAWIDRHSKELHAWLKDNVQ